jgi:hypothetical protein
MPLVSGTITNKDKTDEWGITDEVVRLRVWGTDRTFSLEGRGSELMVGKLASCAIHLADPTGQVSKEHARLRRRGTTWTLHDNKSKNGCFRDGERRLTFEVTPGLEIEIGGVKLIAESAQLASLVVFLQRVLGFDASQQQAVDAALHSIREAATLRAALVVRGEGDLSMIARRFHEHALGTARPFVICKANDDGLAALHSAAHGTLCLLADALPSLWSNTIADWRARSFKARLTMCTSPGGLTDEVVAALRTATAIDIPPLARRSHEIMRIVKAFAEDAVAALGAPEVALTPSDWQWARDYIWPDYTEIEDAMRKLVALRNWDVTAGAAKIGITHVALGRWARRRGLPT